MEIKPGYKRTDVGVIPEEWHVSSLGMHGTTYGGLTGKTKRDFGLGDARYVTFMNVMSNVVINCDIFEHVRVEASETQNLVRLNDLLFNGSSESPEEVAFCAVVLQEVAGLYLNSFCFGYRLKHGTLVNPLFLAYLFRSQAGRQLVKPLAQGSTRYNISKGALLGVSLAFPPFREQDAIAEALSDVDGLLGGLDRLIAKKRDLKQAAMQQLLTGQTRLPGFSKPWVKWSLGDIVQRLPKTNRQSSSGRAAGKYPFFTNSTEPVNKCLDEMDFDREAIIANTGGAAFFNYYTGPFAVMSDCLVLAVNQNARWLYYLLKSMEEDINTRGFFGSGIKHLDKAYFFGLRVDGPSEEAEQLAIATVLVAMDAELAVLQTRRDKTALLKQGMMQELLTGRTRLVQLEDRHA